MGAELKPEKKRCCCPYCDEEMEEAMFPFCQICKATIFFCPKCRESVSKDDNVCSHCGAEIPG